MPRSACSIWRSSEPNGSASPNTSQSQAGDACGCWPLPVYSGRFSAKRLTERPVRRTARPRTSGVAGKHRLAARRGMPVGVGSAPPGSQPSRSPGRAGCVERVDLARPRVEPLEQRLRSASAPGRRSAADQPLSRAGKEVERRVEQQRGDQEGEEQREDARGDRRVAIPGTTAGARQARRARRLRPTAAGRRPESASRAAGDSDAPRARRQRSTAQAARACAPAAARQPPGAGAATRISVAAQSAAVQREHARRAAACGAVPRVQREVPQVDRRPNRRRSSRSANEHDSSAATTMPASSWRRRTRRRAARGGGGRAAQLQPRHRARPERRPAPRRVTADEQRDRQRRRRPRRPDASATRSRKRHRRAAATRRKRRTARPARSRARRRRVEQRTDQEQQGEAENDDDPRHVTVRRQPRRARPRRSAGATTPRRAARPPACAAETRPAAAVSPAPSDRGRRTPGRSGRQRVIDRRDGRAGTARDSTCSAATVPTRRRPSRRRDGHDVDEPQAQGRLRDERSWRPDDAIGGECRTARPLQARASPRLVVDGDRDVVGSRLPRARSTSRSNSARARLGPGAEPAGAAGLLGDPAATWRAAPRSSGRSRAARASTRAAAAASVGPSRHRSTHRRPRPSRRHGPAVSRPAPADRAARQGAGPFAVRDSESGRATRQAGYRKGKLGSVECPTPLA